MKRLFLFFFIFPAHLCGQLCFDFESGDLKTWKQSRDSSWVITGSDALGGKFSLWQQMDDSIASNTRISFSYDSLWLDTAITVWQFTIRHGYLPSSANKWAVFLVSDCDEHQMMPSGTARAMVLGVNFTGSDDLLKLWKTENGNSKELVRTSLNWQEVIGTAPARIRVERSAEGIWEIYLGLDPAGTTAGDSILQWDWIGMGKDTGMIRPEYFGIYYSYSPKQDRKLWFDDLCIKGDFRKDCKAPALHHVEVVNALALRAFFSEPLDMESAYSVTSYKVVPDDNTSGFSAELIIPDTIFRVTESILELVFNEPLASGIPQTLFVEGIADRKGNSSGILQAGFIWYQPVRGDIIINEVMFDPFPELGLPGIEYLELYNRCGYPVKLDGWTLEAGKKKQVFPDFKLPAASYLLICRNDAGTLFEGDLLILDFLSSGTMLSNEGDLLILRDQDADLMDWMEFTPDIHSDEYYAGGGWSLERIDPGRKCFGSDNWTTSASRKGGTPGMANSVHGNNPDRISPGIVSVYVPETGMLVISFSEPMNAEEALQKSTWFVDGGIGEPDSLELLHPSNEILLLKFREAFSPGKEYSLEIKGKISDCEGHPTEDRKIRFALPLPAQRSDILISEILFNPLPFCPDYIEVFNPSLKTFDLGDLRLANRDQEDGRIVSVERIIDGNRLFFPDEYLVFTRDPEALQAFYRVNNPGCLIRADDMPGMGDKQGCVLILDKYMNVLDEVSYKEEMHHPMLGTPEGVSLERLSYVTAAEPAAQWHSASSTEGYGTPGRRNSQALDIDPDTEGFELEPEVFTPDMDGDRDVLLIKYHFLTPGKRARILVLDPGGRLIQEIGQMQLLGTEGFFTWNGTDRQGRLAGTGIYLVLAEVYSSGGQVSRYRRTCVLSKGSR